MNGSGSSPVAGTLLAGRYRLEQPLATGATAAVWRAVDTILGRPVAVKVVREDVDPELRSRFEREGRILGGLQHADLVRVLDAGSEEGRPYIVMELVEGRTLHEVLAAGPLPIETAVEIAGHVATGLSHAHEAGVIHRDVKPANIIITGSGNPKLVDFGIARSESATTIGQSQSVLGTALYLSPEQAQALPVDARTDIYSLGCVLYEMLTGRPPFTGDSAVAIAYRHVHEEPAPPSALRQDVPLALDALVLRMLAKDPAGRPPSARELAAELESSATRGATAPATAVLPPVAAATAVRRRRRWVPGLVALLAILAFVAVAAARGGGPATVEVPDLSGVAFDDASSRLAELGLQVERVDVVDHAPAGDVVGQDPAPGTETEEGATVQLAVSSGPPPPEVNDKDDEKDDEKDDDEEKDEGNNGNGGRGGGKGKDG